MKESNLEEKDSRKGLIKTASNKEASVREGKVLLVEDNIVNQQVAMAIIEKLGYEVVIACNGKEAVELTENSSYAFIIMDCQMPIMDGYEATRIIRRRESQRKLPRTPIIAITANALEGDKNACIDSGMDDYLTKPLQKESLIRLMETEYWRNLNQTSIKCEDRYCRQTLNTLRETLSTEQLEEVVELFIRHTGEKVLELASAIKEGDARMIEANAHSIKGSSANMGMSLLTGFSDEILQGARNGTSGAKEQELIFFQLQNEFKYISKFYKRDVLESMY